jgi:CPA2 family monovalent cation:H+ antiporter-2
VLIILVGKSVAAFLVVRRFGHSRSAALMVSASLAQIGEFSFILADRSLQLGLLPEEGRDLILAGAIISILINPLLFAALDIYAARREKALAEAVAADAQEEETPMREPIRPTSLKDHVVLIGHGRVGSFISSVLNQRNVPLFVIEDDEDGVAELKQLGIAALAGNAADPDVIQAANLPGARCLLVAIPDAFEGGQVVQQARAINPKLPIIARAHSEEEIDYLKRHGATLVVMGEHEIAKAMLDNVAEAAALVEQAARTSVEPPEPVLAEKSAIT